MDITELKKLIPQNKCDITNIEKLLSLSDDDIEQIIPELLEWLQDMNWLVAEKVSNVLSYRCKIAEPYVIELLLPTQKDDIWKYWLIKCLISNFKDKPTEKLINAIERIAKNPTSGEHNEEVDIAAKWYLDNL